jgi:hypothetical protein
MSLSVLSNALVMLYVAMSPRSESWTDAWGNFAFHVILFFLFAWPAYKLLFSKRLSPFLATLIQPGTKATAPEIFRGIGRKFLRWSSDKFAAKTLYYLAMFSALAYVELTVIMLIITRLTISIFWPLIVATVCTVATYLSARDFVAEKVPTTNRMVLFPLVGSVFGQYWGVLNWFTLIVALLAHIETRSPTFRQLHPTVKGIVVTLVLVFALMFLGPFGNKVDALLQKRS